MKNFTNKSLYVLSFCSAIMLQGCHSNVYYDGGGAGGNYGGGWTHGGGGFGGHHGGGGHHDGGDHGGGGHHDGGDHGGGGHHDGGDHGGGGYHDGGGHGGGFAGGRGDFGGGGGHNGGGGHHIGVDSLTAETSVMSDRIADDLTPAERSVYTLQRDFGISEASAVKVAQIGQSRHLHHDLRSMGLNPEDFASLSKLEMPKPESINQVANTLGEDAWKVEKMFSSYINDMKARR